MPSLTNPAAPLSPATGGRGRFQDAIKGPAPLFLVGCEYSATVRDALRARGINAYSCDILPTEGDPRWHVQGDIRDAIRSRQWDAILLHIECTAMAVCGNRHYAKGTPGYSDRLNAIEWSVGTVQLALDNCDHVAVENPASVIFPHLRRMGADVQYIQPWEHGHPEQKKTGLALWGLPRIAVTKDVYAEMMALPRKERERIFFMSPGNDRGHERSRFYTGFADAFATQWGEFLLQSLNNIRSDDPEAQRCHAIRKGRAA